MCLTIHCMAALRDAKSIYFIVEILKITSLISRYGDILSRLKRLRPLNGIEFFLCLNYQSFYQQTVPVIRGLSVLHIL